MIGINNFPSVADIQEITTTGPWRTKSGGNLEVLFALPPEAQNKFFTYDAAELGQVPDIRGLRLYQVHGIPQNGIGGGEFHKVRQEIIFASKGVFVLSCEDLDGQKQDYTLMSSHGISGLWLPPYILHSYRALLELEWGSSLLVLANTLYDPNNPRTHDAYSLNEFRKLQKEVICGEV